MNFYDNHYIYENKCKTIERTSKINVFASFQNSRPLHCLCNYRGVFGVFQHLHFSSWISVTPYKKVQDNNNYLSIILNIVCRTSCMDHGKCMAKVILVSLVYIISDVISGAVTFILLDIPYHRMNLSQTSFWNQTLNSWPLKWPFFVKRLDFPHKVHVLYV